MLDLRAEDHLRFRASLSAVSFSSLEAGKLVDPNVAAIAA